MPPHEIDIGVGSRIRLRRRLLRKGQAELAAELGVTYQQLQKYERGDNRVSASTLWRIAQSLGVPVTYFFNDVVPPGDGETDFLDRRLMHLLQSEDGAQFIEALANLPKGPVRKNALALLQSIGETRSEEDGLQTGAPVKLRLVRPDEGRDSDPGSPF